MINVGLTELHGIAKEVMKNPPEGVQYSEAASAPLFTDWFIRSPAKDVLAHFPGEGYDLLEAPLFPILTNKPWIYTPARFSGATSFNILGVPLPKFLRVFFVKRLMLRKNFLKLIFKSEEGLKTLQSYANIRDPRILDKVDVVYPAIREVDPALIRYNEDRVNFMFSGDFFRKGGANVVDAFERLQQKYDNVYLRICSLPDFRIGNAEVRQDYIDRVENNPRIEFGYVDRDDMLNTVLPETDVFVSPTYEEAFGFALLEASAYGIPVISTRLFAIPEIIEHGVSGYLIDIDQFDFIKKGKNTIVRDIPADFHKHVSDKVFEHMDQLASDAALRKQIGENGLRIAKTKFSFDERNKKMKRIYEEGLAAFRGDTA